MSDFEILKRLFDDYSKKYLKKISLAFFLSLVLAASTSSVAYLLDPAIKQLFIEKNQTLVLVIPILIILAFATKGASKAGVDAIKKKFIERLTPALANIGKQTASGASIEAVTEGLQFIVSEVTQELIKEGKIKDTKSFSSFAPKKGTALYRRTREIYDA